MIDLLNRIDTWLFLLLNGLHTAWLDELMFWISYKLTWIPLYVFFIVLLIRKYKLRIFWILVFVAILITLSDQLSVLMKNLFQRLRPCHNDELNLLIHTVKDKCGGKYGFVSSHASNTFTLAVFLIPFLKSYWKGFSFSLIFWAALVSYSRIYLGIHYPGDILCGALLGAAIGITLVKVYNFFSGYLACSKR